MAKYLSYRGSRRLFKRTALKTRRINLFNVTARGGRRF